MLVVIFILLFALFVAFIVILAAIMLSSQISRIDADYVADRLMLDLENSTAEDEDY